MRLQMLEMQLQNFTVEENAALPMNRTWMIDSAGPAFSGRVWVGGKKVTVPAPATTQFLKVYLDGATECEWVEAMPNTMDSDAEVFDIDETFGDIHLPGNFGGG